MFEIRTAYIFSDEDEVQEYLNKEIDYVPLGTKVMFFSNLGATVVTKNERSEEHERAELEKERANKLNALYVDAPIVDREVDFDELGFVYHENIISNQAKLKALELVNSISWSDNFVDEETGEDYPVEGALYQMCSWATEIDTEDELGAEEIVDTLNCVALYAEAMGDIFLAKALKDTDTLSFEELANFFSDVQFRKEENLSYQTYTKFLSTLNNTGTNVSMTPAVEDENKKFEKQVKLLVDGEYIVEVTIAVDKNDPSPDGTTLKNIDGKIKNAILLEIENKLANNQEGMYDIFTDEDIEQVGHKNVELNVGINYYEYNLPSYWASYLVNSDPSGLDDQEIAEVDEWVNNEIKKNELSSFHCVSASEAPFFARDNDANSLGGDVLEYVFHAVSYERLVKEQKEKNREKRDKAGAIAGKQMLMNF